MNVKVESQFQVITTQATGPIPATDAAIFTLLNTTKDVKPLMGYELKVHMDFINPVASHVLELFLQAFYSLQHFKLSSCMYCVTDTWSWCYFKIVPECTIASYHHFRYSDYFPTEQELKDHCTWSFIRCLM